LEFTKIKFVLFKLFLILLFAHSSISSIGQNKYENKTHNEIINAIQYCFNNDKFKHVLDSLSLVNDNQLVILIPSKYLSLNDKLLYKSKQVSYQTKKEIFINAIEISVLEVINISVIPSEKKQSTFVLKFGLVNFNTNNQTDNDGVTFVGGHIINISLIRKKKRWVSLSIKIN
jgi:hypothetical protein